MGGFVNGRREKMELISKSFINTKCHIERSRNVGLLYLPVFDFAQTDSKLNLR